MRIGYLPIAYYPDIKSIYVAKLLMHGCVVGSMINFANYECVNPDRLNESIYLVPRHKPSVYFITNEDLNDSHFFVSWGQRVDLYAHETTKYAWVLMSVDMELQQVIASICTDLGIFGARTC